MKHVCHVCGTPQASADKRRSVPQLRRYFALIRAAFTHWPDAHDFRPDNAEHLRRWLQCKAGHHEATRIEIPSGDPAVINETVAHHRIGFVKHFSERVDQHCCDVSHRMSDHRFCQFLAVFLWFYGLSRLLMLSNNSGRVVP